MRSEFVPDQQTAKEMHCKKWAVDAAGAQDICPWAAEVVEAEGGWWCLSRSKRKNDDKQD